MSALTHANLLFNCDLCRDNLDYEAIRSDVREQILKGLFGPPETGIFSASLQATIYDIGCLILTAIKSIQTVTLSTPNIHYLPMMALNTLGDSDLKFEHAVMNGLAGSSSTACRLSQLCR